MNETLRKELTDKGIILTYEQWWLLVGDAFTYVNNKFDPKVLYEEYVNEIIADYEKIEREKKR